MWSATKMFLHNLNPFNATTVINTIIDHSTSIQTKMDRSVKLIEELKEGYSSFDDKLRAAEQEKEETKNLLIDIGDALPDMIWAKDTEGKYVYANQQLIDNLLFSGCLHNTIGRTDVELATARKQQIGPDNHTFGELCANSDAVTIKAGEARYFVEYGLISGRFTVLQVHKNVRRDTEGNIIGTVGTGRDITEEHETLRKISESTECGDTKAMLEGLLAKYKFEG